MSDRPSNQNDEQQSSFSEDVQDYLDSLLSPAAESKTDHRSSQLLDGRFGRTVDQSARLVQNPPLTMVAGTAVGLNPLPKKLVRNPEPVRPFAEPTKPVAFKLPLAEADIKPKAAPKPKVAPKPTELPVATPLTKTVKDIPAVKEPPSPPPVTVVDTPSVVSEPAIEASEQTPVNDQAEDAAAIKITEWMANGRPSWAQHRFECLLFSVGGLTLAVPLVELGAIHPMNEELTPIFGQIDWFMGLLPVRNKTIKTVNTAKVVMPERYRDSMQSQFNYVISINGVDWGLAVDNVSNAIALEPEQVRWRTARSNRPWLAGTVVEHMCALLDVSQLAAMFIEQNRPRPRH